MSENNVRVSNDLVAHLLSTIKTCSDFVSCNPGSDESVLFDCVQFSIEDCFIKSGFSDVLLAFADEFSVNLVSDSFKDNKTIK